MPDPAVPPTPPVPLAALLARDDLGLRQIAGPSGPGLAVHWAHTSEMADPYPYLLGGELLLTAGVHFPEASGPREHFDAYVARVVAAGGAALGFGLAPVHDSVPPALVAACEAHGLPLLEVPPRTTFSGVARAVWQLMAEARHAELRRVTKAQQSLAAAASRPDPVPSVLRQLARRVDGWAALYRPEGVELATAGREPGGGAREALAELARAVVARGSATASDTAAGGDRLTAYALGAGRSLVLGVASSRREPGDHTVVSVAAVLLSLLTAERRAATGAAHSSALVRLLLGAAPQEVAPLLGGGRWRVVHGRPQGRAPDAMAAVALGAALGSALVDSGERSEQGAGDAVVRALVPAGREPDAQEGWALGVSAAVEPGEWAVADVQAARALARAHATRTALVRHGARSALADLVPAGEAEAHARALLAPLADAPALTETLRTWLSLHGSWDRTATALSVHRNTVRQRMARCAALLAVDLNDPDVRMELWFALKRG
ncbi:PucR family transcriptional regulator ligand-binding domain-containing protein [Streptomyces sp. NPDC006172]|uniref:PucR family transcriptional regulator ligand-binding domain-containing protein n=1 Tax=Streptomyces sp. NPDC006172 TaxID=3154470 RepID=UPI0033F58500